MRFISLLWFLLIFMACAEDNTISDPQEPAPRFFRYLALGDSYTIGTAIGKDSAYAALLGDSLQAAFSMDSVDYQVIAKNGWTTADLKNGISVAAPDSSFDIVTLLIGVNNQYQGRSISEYESEFQELLLHSVALAGGAQARVLVISIPDWGVSPAGAGNRGQIASQIDAFNAAQKAICDSLGISFVDITALSRNGLNTSELIARDGLHFSRKMHQLWMRKIYPLWYAKISQS